MSLFDIEGLDELSDTMIMIGEVYPKEVKKFMQLEGNKLKNRTLKTARSSVGKKTGNFEKGIKRGKYYKYSKTGADSIRVYSGSPAFHGHLIEYDHKQVTPKTRTTKKSGKLNLKNGGKYIKDVLGYHIFSVSRNMFESQYEKDCEDFADKITEPLNKG